MRRRRVRRRGTVLAVLGASGLLLLACLLPSAALAAYPGANGRIAYVGHVPTETYSDIFTALPDGSGLQQLTETRVSELDPSWSASGRRLAYARVAPGSRGYQVFTMSASGANQTQVTADIGSHRSPSFSPSGRRIVYEKRGKIFTIRTNGSDRRRIVPYGAASPEYSPDGKRIVLAGSPNGREDGIWTVRPDGSHLRRLTRPGRRGNYDETPAWSPNGKHIVFLRCSIDGSTHGCDGRVYLMRAYGRYKHPIRRAWGHYPAFSPTGHRIALTRYRHETCSDVYTITPWGTKPRMVTHNCLTADAFAAHASWQPVSGG